MPSPEFPQADRTDLKPQGTGVDASAMGSGPKIDVRPSGGPNVGLGETPGRRSLIDRAKNLVRTPLRKVTAAGTAVVMTATIAYAADRIGANQPDASTPNPDPDIALSANQPVDGASANSPKQDVRPSAPAIAETPQEAELRGVRSMFADHGWSSILPQVKADAEGNLSSPVHDVIEGDAPLHVASFLDAIGLRYNPDAAQDTVDSVRNLDGITLNAQDPFGDGSDITAVLKRKDPKAGNIAFVPLKSQDHPLPSWAPGNMASGELAGYTDYSQNFSAVAIDKDALPAMNANGLLAGEVFLQTYEVVITINKAGNVVKASDAKYVKQGTTESIKMGIVRFVMRAQEGRAEALVRQQTRNDKPLTGFPGITHPVSVSNLVDVPFSTFSSKPSFTKVA